MLRSIAMLIMFAAGANAHGAGVWKDPNHYVGDSSLAGLRFVAEFPAHTLTMVGTDDGKVWWRLQGTCSGPAMTEINFDFSSKGGPPKLTGTWSAAGDIELITWPDGNSWTSMGPTNAFEVTTTDTYHGLFIDPAHLIAGTFAGVRVIAEEHHTLHMVGSDDGKSWWYLKGICHDADHNPMFKFDFSPKGGPADLTAWWDHHTIIKFPDGNEWYKPPFINKVEAEPFAARVSLPLSATAGAVLLVLAVTVLVWKARKGRLAHHEQF